MSNWTIGGYLISFVTLIWWGFALKKSNPSTQEQTNPALYILAALLFLLSLYPRVIEAHSITYGMFVFEEMGASINYLAQLIAGEQSYSGATQIVFAIVLDTWRNLFGFAASTDRYLSASMGMASLVAFFVGIKNILNVRVALILSALIAAGIYTSFFSRVIIEIGWSLFFLGLNIVLLNLAVKKNTAWAFLLFGVSIGLGVFTYPGYTVGLAAFVFSALLTLIFSKNKSEILKQNVKPLLFACAGVFIISTPALIFHYTQQAGAPLFFGGGVPLASQWTYSSSLWTHITDIFWAANSYYLPFLDAVFFESSFWGFFLIGSVSLWKSQNKKLLFFLLNSLVGLLLIVSLATNFPGMRRGIISLPIFYLLVAVGIVHLLQLEMSRIKKALTTVIVFGAFVAPNYYMIRSTFEAKTALPYSYLNEIFQSNQTYEMLKSKHVTLIQKNLSELEKTYPKLYLYLLNRYSHVDYRENFSLQDLNGDLILSTKKENLFLTTDPDIFDLLSMKYKLCIVWQARYKTLALPVLIARLEQKSSPDCKATLNN